MKISICLDAIIVSVKGVSDTPFLGGKVKRKRKIKAIFKEQLYEPEPCKNLLERKILSAQII